MVETSATQEVESQPIDTSNIMADLLGSLDINSLDRVQLQRLAQVRQERTMLANDGGIWIYKPQSKLNDAGVEVYQKAFHQSTKKIRWIFGGNKSAKSYSVKCEDVWWALGDHPYRKVPGCTRGWIVSLDFPSSRDVSERLLQQLIPKSRLVNWDSSKGIIKVKAKKGISEITLKSCDSGVEKFQGADLDFIDFDEEPKFEIYRECLPRLWIRRGSMWCAETPTNGMSWTYDMILQEAGINPDIEVFNFSSLWNKYLSREAMEQEMKFMDQEERDMRIEGKHIQLSGLVYKEFDEKVNVIPAEGFRIPAEWKKYRTIDHGINNPTACLWVAINPQNEMYVYDEYYETEKTVSENAANIRQMTGGTKIEWTTIDPSTQNREAMGLSSIFKEYQRCGVYCRALREDKGYGINKIKSMLKIDEQTGRPKLFFLSHCTATIREIKRYRYATQRGHDDKNNTENVQKSFDHAMDAIRYLVMSNPQYFEESYEEVHEPAWY